MHPARYIYTRSRPLSQSFFQNQCFQVAKSCTAYTPMLASRPRTGTLNQSIADPRQSTPDAAWRKPRPKALQDKFCSPRMLLRDLYTETPPTNSIEPANPIRSMETGDGLTDMLNTMKFVSTFLQPVTCTHGCKRSFPWTMDL